MSPLDSGRALDAILVPLQMAPRRRGISSWHLLTTYAETLVVCLVLTWSLLKVTVKLEFSGNFDLQPGKTAIEPCYAFPKPKMNF